MSKNFSINLASPVIYAVWGYALFKTYQDPVFWVLIYLFIKELHLTLTWNWR